MKKFTLFFIFFYFIFNIEGNAKTTRLKGINEVDLLIEKLDESAAEKCSITEKKIETTVKYVLSNSKIKISENTRDPLLYIRVMLINDGTACSVYSRITVEHFIDAPFNSGNRGAFIYYKNERMSSGGINSGIGKHAIDKIEEMMKEFVIRHHEDNL